MTNFDFLLKEKQFSGFAQVAVNAEKLIHVDIETSAINCRRAMEFAVKWMYSVDSSLVMPYDNNIHSLLRTEEFRDIVDKDTRIRLDLIRKVGNNAAHNSNGVSLDEVKLCLENLFIFMDFVAYCYGNEYTEQVYDKKLLDNHIKNNESKDATRKLPTRVKRVAVKKVDNSKDNEINFEIDLEKLMKENASLKEELTAKRDTPASGLSMFVLGLTLQQ